MTTRTDVQVIWQHSPRAVIFDTPPLTVQDLVDTIRKLEDSFEGMSHPHMLNASGKESLGGGVSVGITVQLQDTDITFKPQIDVISTGSATSTTSSINTGLTLFDTGATFQADGVKRGDIIVNDTTTAIEHSIVIDVVSETELFMLHLENNPALGWTATDTYTIFQNDLGKISGGNTTAVDDVDVAMEPVFGTFGVFPQLELSSSATISDGGGGGLTLDEFLAFQNKCG